MEMRTVQQVRVYKLVMNSVFDRAEMLRLCAVSTNYDELVEWYKEQRAPEPYRSEHEPNILKHFQEGSPLEYFNPIGAFEVNAQTTFGYGIRDEWDNIEDFNNIIDDIRNRNLCHIVSTN